MPWPILRLWTTTRICRNWSRDQITVSIPFFTSLVFLQDFSLRLALKHNRKSRGGLYARPHSRVISLFRAGTRPPRLSRPQADDGGQVNPCP
jgi:hypothetical protein